jgi:rhodanese-related sulfurtransferase
MSSVLCLEPGCNETVELPGDVPIALTEEILPPREREIVIVCPRGHRKIYVLRS